MQLKPKIFFTLRILLVFFMFYGGINHFIKPQFYEAFVPDFFKYKTIIIYLSGIIEIILSLALLTHRFRIVGTQLIFVLLLLFLPIHIADAFSNTPAVGSHKLALIRLCFQFIFLAWTWSVYQYHAKKLRKN